MAEATDALREFARTALLDITADTTIGEFSRAEEHDDGVLTLYFVSTLPGYRGWNWTVSLAMVDGAEPTVLETELTPGEDALLSPDWVPWADRLAEYLANQESAEDDDDDDDEDDDDEFDDDDELNGDDDYDDSDDDDDDDGFSEVDEHDLDGDPDDTVHDGDVDGVDIEEALESAATQLNVEEADEAQADAHDAGPQKTRRPRRARG